MRLAHCYQNVSRALLVESLREDKKHPGKVDAKSNCCHEWASYLLSGTLNLTS